MELAVERGSPSRGLVSRAAAGGRTPGQVYREVPRFQPEGPLPDSRAAAGSGPGVNFAPLSKRGAQGSVA